MEQAMIVMILSTDERNASALPDQQPRKCTRIACQVQNTRGKHVRGHPCWLSHTRQLLGGESDLGDASIGATARDAGRVAAPRRRRRRRWDDPVERSTPTRGRQRCAVRQRAVGDGRGAAPPTHQQQQCVQPADAGRCAVIGSTRGLKGKM